MRHLHASDVPPALAVSRTKHLIVWRIAYVARTATACVCRSLEPLARLVRRRCVSSWCASPSVSGRTCGRRWCSRLHTGGFAAAGCLPRVCVRPSVPSDCRSGKTPLPIRFGVFAPGAIPEHLCGLAPLLLPRRNLYRTSPAAAVFRWAASTHRMRVAERIGVPNRRQRRPRPLDAAVTEAERLEAASPGEPLDFRWW
jgi:hypothetical protein